VDGVNICPADYNHIPGDLDSLALRSMIENLLSYKKEIRNPKAFIQTMIYNTSRGNMSKEIAFINNLIDKSDLS